MGTATPGRRDDGAMRELWGRRIDQSGMRPAVRESDQAAVLLCLAREREARCAAVRAP